MAAESVERIELEIAGDLYRGLLSRARAQDSLVGAVIVECVRGELETQQRYHALVQRQDAIDTAILEIARLIGLLFAEVSGT